MDAADKREQIRDRALALGFDAVGFAPASLGDEARERLSDFLAQGLHGDMGWMLEKADRRGDPQVLWPEARTVIALGMSYAPHEDPRGLLEHPDRGIIDTLERGFKFRRQPLLVMITNSGSDRKSVCWEEHQHAIKAAAGTATPTRCRRR